MKPIPLSIYYINIRGFKTKSISLEAIVAALNPDVVVLCETEPSQHQLSESSSKTLVMILY